MINPTLEIDRVALAVGDLDRSVNFYNQVLGLPVAERDERRALLGPDGNLELLALEHPARPVRGTTGLFHVAWLHPDRAALAATLRRLVAAGGRLDGASDHGVSEALYLSDPDGLGIELYTDRPRERWQHPPTGGVVMYTAALDLPSLLATFEGQPGPEIDPGTKIGHVHLKVSDVARSLEFYRDRLGFEEQAEMPSAAFVSAAGYHHHLGLNSWESRGGAPGANDAPGLRRIDFSFADQEALEPLEPYGSAEDGYLDVTGPDGELLRFSA